MNCDGVSSLLSAYLDGELSPGELLRVEEHLRRCHACADEVDSLRQTMALVASLDEVEVPASFQIQLHQRLVALGPPMAAVRRTPAAPSWQRNVRRWAVPAAAAAAALAIGLTGFEQVGQKLPGLTSEGAYTITNPAQPSVAPPTTDQNVAHIDAGTQTANPGTQPVGNAKPPVTPPPAPPVTEPGKTAQGPGPKGAGVDQNPVTPPTTTTTKSMVYTFNVTVKGPLDPKVEAQVLAENTRVEKGNNTLTIYVPSGSYQQWLDKVLNKYWPGISTVVDASQPRDVEMAAAQERLAEAVRRQEADQKVTGPEREAILASDKQQIEAAQADLDLLREQIARATIMVTFQPAP